MDLVTRGESWQGPRTLVARWLRASILEQKGLADLLKQEVDRVGRWEEDPEQAAADIAVVREAFAMVIRRRFDPGVDVRVISSWVHGMHEAVPQLPVLAGEAMVRQALGEEVDTADVPLTHSVIICWFLFLKGYIELYKDPVNGADETVLDEILVAAEQCAADQGHRPVYMSDLNIEPFSTWIGSMITS